MNLGLCIVIAVALALIVGIISHLVTVSNLKKNAESKIGNAETRAREIIDDAVKTAETTKKEALLEVKEESIKTKNDLEKETKERRAELQRYEKRVLAKEEAVISGQMLLNIANRNLHRRKSSCVSVKSR